MADLEAAEPLPEKGQVLSCKVVDSAANTLVVTLNVGSTTFEGVLLNTTSREQKYGAGFLQLREETEKPRADVFNDAMDVKSQSEKPPTEPQNVQVSALSLRHSYNQTSEATDRRLLPSPVSGLSRAWRLGGVRAMRLRPRQTLCAHCSAGVHDNDSNGVKQAKSTRNRVVHARNIQSRKLDYDDIVANSKKAKTSVSGNNILKQFTAKELKKALKKARQREHDPDVDRKENIKKEKEKVKTRSKAIAGKNFPHRECKVLIHDICKTTDPKAKILPATLTCRNFRSALKQRETSTARSCSTVSDTSENLYLKSCRDQPGSESDEEQTHNSDESLAPIKPLRISSHNVHCCVTQDQRVLRVDDIVWGKVHGFPWWPGRIESILESQKNDDVIVTQTATVVWFASNTLSSLPCSQVVNFEDNFLARFNKKKKGPYRMAIQQARDAIQTI